MKSPLSCREYPPHRRYYPGCRSDIAVMPHAHFQIAGHLLYLVLLALVDRFKVFFNHRSSRLGGF